MFFQLISTLRRMGRDLKGKGREMGLICNSAVESASANTVRALCSAFHIRSGTSQGPVQGILVVTTAL